MNENWRHSDGRPVKVTTELSERARKIHLAAMEAADEKFLLELAPKDNDVRRLQKKRVDLAHQKIRDKVIELMQGDLK